jgi:Ras homolog gene family, member A
MYNHPYHFEFYDTASPENWTLLEPGVVILCFDVTDRVSLDSLGTRVGGFAGRALDEWV